MKIRPSAMPMTEVISIPSVGTDMSVAYSLISLRGRLSGPEMIADETPSRRTETGVQMTRREVISSMKTLGLGFTSAT